jgi:hypothetical protein
MAGNPEFAQRLATDHNLLEEFRRDPVAIAKREGISLDTEQREAVTGLDTIADSELIERVPFCI